MIIIRVNMITTHIVISLESHLHGLGLTSGQHSNTDYSNTGEYSTSSAEYRGFGYYHHGADIVQFSASYYSDAGFSSQSHLSLLDLTHKHIITLMEIIHLVSILIVGIMITMILCFITIQCENDYISRYL